MKVQQAVGSGTLHVGPSSTPGLLRRLRRVIFRLSRIGTAEVADDVARYVVMSNYVALSAGLAAALFALLHLLYAPRAHLPITLTLVLLLAATLAALWCNSRGRYLTAATTLIVAVPLAMLQNDWYLGNQLGASQFVFACIPGALLIIPARHRGYLVTAVTIFVLTYLASQFLFDEPQIPSDPRFIRVYNLLCTLANFALLGSYYFLFYLETHRVELLREKAALEKLQQYREVVDNVLEGVFRTAQDGRTLNANPALAQLLGYESVEQLIASVTDFRTQVLADMRERKAMQRELDRSDRVSAFEMRVRRRDGSIFLASLSVHTLRDEQGRVWGYDGIMADVTVRRRHEELIRERQVAEAATQAKSEFLAKMSHELRTPMNAVIGFTDLALRTESEAKRIEHLRHIDSASRSLLHIVNDILDLSKIEAGKLVLEHREFELQPLLEKQIDLFAAQAAAKGLELIVPAPIGIPGVLVGDALRLEQVLVNLIGNALKFTEKGEVELGLRVLGADADTVYLEFCVRDTGIGLSAEQQGRLFSAFAQADASTTRRYGGTGLGLAICKQLVELMGGRIGVESEVGRGSRFWFQISLPVGATQPVSTSTSTSAETLSGLRVLVVDDNAAALDACRAMLESIRVQACTARSGAEALGLINRQDVDAVLVDATMPDMDGLETLRCLRADPRRRSLPVWMMAPPGRDGLLQQAEQAGAEGCLDKPIKLTVLRARLLGGLSRAPGASLAGPALDANVQARHLRGARVLLAEDNPLNRRLAAEILCEAGVLVDHVEDGEQAIAAVRGADYALVLMDVQMPVLDGLEATRAIRKLPQGTHLPIVAMTANAMQGDREQCLAAGMDDFLTKPIDAAQLLSMLARRIGPSAGASVTPAARSPSVTPELPLPDALPGIDIAGALRRIGPRPQLLVELLHELVDGHAQTAALICAQLDEGRAIEARRAAHTLKGMAASLGCVALSERARDLEQGIECGQHVGELQARCAQLAAAFDLVREAVAQLPHRAAGRGDASPAKPEAHTDSVSELQRRIEARSFDASQAFSAAEPALRALGDAARVRRLSGALARFDFASAGRLLAELQDGSAGR